MIIFLATVELRPAESVPRSPCGNSPGLLYGDLDDTRPTDSLVRNKLGGGGSSNSRPIEGFFSNFVIYWIGV